MRKKTEETPPPFISMDYVSRGVAGKFTVHSFHSDGVSAVWTANDYDWSIPCSYSLVAETKAYGGGFSSYPTGWYSIFHSFTRDIDFFVTKQQEEFFTAKASPAHTLACCCGCRKVCNEV